MRTVIEGVGFANSKFKIHSDAEVLDAILEAVVFTLSRDPHAGTRIDNSPIWALPLRRWLPIGLPAITLYYMFDATTVTLVGFLADSEA